MSEVSISATQRLKTSLVDAVEECRDYPEDGVTLVIRERARQVQGCGYSTNHDDEHKFGELRAAAIAYLLSPDIGGEGSIDHWPFERESFKPGVGIEPLVKAGAMIVAEIDRLLRAQAAQQETTSDREPFSMQSPPANPDAAVCQPAPSNTLQQLADVQEKLAAYRDVCQRLWPFVRYFIIAGACPEAISCVVDLGRLLGHTEASKSTIAEIGERVRAETLNEVAARLETLLRGTERPA